MIFSEPALISLTAPTCAGKNFLLERLIGAGYNRIVSTTTRAKRNGEIEGVHYYFISPERSLELETANEFAELVTYNGHRYGVTSSEMENKLMPNSKPGIIILEPNGVMQYQKYCAIRNIRMFKVFIHLSENERLERLVKRTAEDLKTGDHTAVLRACVKRTVDICDKERGWISSNLWDVVVPGDDADDALDSIEAKLAQAQRNINSLRGF